MRQKALLLLPALLWAQTMRAETGQMYVSASYGRAQSRSGNAVRDLDKGQNDAFTGGRFGYTTFLRGSSDQIQWNALANAAAPDLKMSGSQARFAFEYALNSFAGFGFTIADQRWNVRGIRSNISSDPSVLLLLSSVFQSSSSQAYNQALIGLELLDPLVTSNALPYWHATSINALGRLHPLEGMFDPYAGLSIGLAREWISPSYAWRVEPALGVRIHTGRFFAEVEASYSMLFAGRKGSIPLPPRRRLNEFFLQAGAGVRVD